MQYVLDIVGDGGQWATAVFIIIWTVQYSILAPWWRHFMGITITGLAWCLLGIYIPSLMALADPAAFANFAQARWYQWLATFIVGASAVFVGSRIILWEVIRRRRNGRTSEMLPSVMAKRIAELEAENARLRDGVS